MLPLKCVPSLICGYLLKINVNEDLREDGVQWNQELIGTLMCEVEIVRLYILFEVSLM